MAGDAVHALYPDQFAADFGDDLRFFTTFGQGLYWECWDFINSLKLFVDVVSFGLLS